MNQIDLSNRVAVITGGAQGFGYSMAERFSDSNATVIIWDKDEDLMKSLSLPKNTHTMKVDVTSYKNIEISAKHTLDTTHASDNESTG